MAPTSDKSLQQVGVDMTAVVLKLDLAARAPRLKRNDIVTTRCEVIIFPGVRFERLPDKKTPTGKPKRRATR